MGAARGVLREVFGFEAFRPGQEAVIETLLDGRHALTVMPTGSGKSLCFQIPALVMDGLTVVVSPLIALMQDQVSALGLAGVAADCINSANDRDANVAAWRRAAEGRTRLPYGNKEVAFSMGARYGADGWYAPPGVDLDTFRERGWL